MPMRMRSKTLSGRGACSTSIAPASRAAGVAESSAVETSALLGATVDSSVTAVVAEPAAESGTGVEEERLRRVTSLMMHVRCPGPNSVPGPWSVSVRGAHQPPGGVGRHGHAPLPRPVQ